VRRSCYARQGVITACRYRLLLTIFCRCPLGRLLEVKRANALSWKGN